MATETGLISRDVMEQREEERRLYDAVRNMRHELPIKTLCKLLDLRFKKLQKQMLEADVNEFRAVQIEARVVSALLKELSTG